ncbi:DNA-binding response regulator [Paenibacillus flagellatus]|uniref:DNA-binding response regulator n=2 Tax=Paenibacillus flagellatus TaxID=2211139 RepID=A0A2V5K2W5_9BACL|nr:response regulator [Paenibacillus flagellatus]PYI53599.1 DNA-binding response regulator [Paenibacillus flagellatus]
MYKVLLVEDEEVIRQGFRHWIPQVTSEFAIGWEASHGKEALAILKTDMPDAVITDIRMREMDGLALCAKIRERYPDLPIVIVSGHSDFAYAHGALRLGVADYLIKPIRRTALIQALERVKALIRKTSGVREEPPAGDVPERPPAESHQLIRKVKAHIQAHPDGDLRLQTLADIVHLNPAYLSQLFKAVTQSNLSDYITEARLERAKHLLATTGLKVFDVARLSGYQSPKHFMLVFKQATGVTPSDYRARQAAGTEPG